MVDEPANNATETPAGEPKKKSKVLFLSIIGAGILILGGGGFFAYKMFFPPNDAPPSIEEELAETRKDSSGAVIGEILSMAPFTVNLADPRGKRYLKVKIEVEFETPEAVEKATAASPRLRDTVIMMLTSLSFEEVMTPEGKTRIRDELHERFSQILKPDKVRSIFFTEFVVQ